VTPRNAWGSPREAERQAYSKVEKAEAWEKFSSGRPLDELIWLTTHCTDGYRNRFRPDAPPSVAKGELYRLLHERGVYMVGPPGWHITSNKSSVGYVVIDDEILLPIRVNRQQRRPYVAVTCLYRVF
jgi:hypothetical protein